MSPLSMPKIQEQREEEGSSTSSRPRSSLNLILKKQQATVDEPEPPLIKSNSLDKPGSPTTPRENDESVLHGSSEFMLVLYPEDQDQGKKYRDIDGRRKTLGKIRPWNIKYRLILIS